MYERLILQDLDEYFKELSARTAKGVYFYRLSGWSSGINSFIKKYYETARTSGVIIEGRIPNPTEGNLAYYEELMGLNFQMSMGFLTSSLRKWLPRMDESQRQTVAGAIYDTLEEMRRQGKNDNILKNAYIKFMCWLYYRFERIVNQLGREKLPKILYEGEISIYELKLLSVLSKAGSDVMLLQYRGDESYLKVDPAGAESTAYPVTGLDAFPEGFSLAQIRKEMEEELRLGRLYGIPSKLAACTNAWTEGRGLDDILIAPGSRGGSPEFFYNCFIRINGVEDKLTYLNQLYQFQLQLKRDHRKLVVVEKEIAQPGMDEIAAVRRSQYTNQEQMMADLSKNIQYTANIELQRLMVKAFLDVLIEESKRTGSNLNRLTNRAVYLLCWIRRYQPELFYNWKEPETACFILLGTCRTENEAMFLKFLSRLPVDVLVLIPDRAPGCCLEDKMLYELNYSDTMTVNKFPREDADIRMGTAAYHAERELDGILYQDTGMFRNQQYEKAVSVTLQTMYEEIGLLWDQELKYRPNFSVIDQVVNLPVLFAKVSGVKDGDVSAYWAGIKRLITEDTFVIRSVPFVKPTDPNPMKAYATQFLKNRRVQKAKIKAHPVYQYGFLREEMQEHLLEKIQILIDQSLIRGTFENGTEYTILATALNLNKELIRLIQKFDFTKKNPKLIYINTQETMISLEDSIITAFLNLVGFDVVFFVPTGYRNVEKYFSDELMEEHQTGEYLYDLQIPDFNSVPSTVRRSWREKIFKRGN